MVNDIERRRTLRTMALERYLYDIDWNEMVQTLCFIKAYYIPKAYEYSLVQYGYNNFT